MSGEVRLSAAVMTHPTRLVSAQALCHAHPELGLRIVLDPQPQGPPSAARTAVLAWAAVDVAATHHLVLQDDVVLGVSFRDRVMAAIAQRPHAAICLFTEWAGATSHAVRLGAWLGQGWVDVCDPYTPSVAMVLPAQAARQAGQLEPGIAQDDELLADLLQRSDVPACATVPNLVQHGQQSSLIGNSAMGMRLAACFASHDVAAADLRLDLIPCFSRAVGRPYYLRRSASGWQALAPIEVLSERGVDTQGLRQQAAKQAAALVAGTPGLRPDVAAGLWLTAWAHGAELAWLLARAGGSVSQALQREIGWVALSTLGPGIFDQYLPAKQLHNLGPLLDEYTTDAFTEGVLRVGIKENR